MFNKLPRWVFVVFGVLGFTFLAGGQYLEWRQPAWLAAHPITANMIASVIAFSIASLVVGVGFNFVTDHTAKREAEERRNTQLLDLFKGLGFLAYQAIPLLPSHVVSQGQLPADPSQLPDSMTLREIVDMSTEVMDRLGNMRIELRADYGRFYWAAQVVFYNAIKPYAEEHLVGSLSYDRTQLLTMEDALREGRTLLTFGYPDSDRMSRQNLDGFGKLVVRFIEDVIRAGHVRGNRDSA